MTIPAKMRQELGIYEEQETSCEIIDGKLALIPKKSIFELLKNFKRPKQKRKYTIREEKDAMMRTSPNR